MKMNLAKSVTILLLSSFALVLVVLSGLYISSWYYRCRAVQLVEAASQLKPGTTTTPEYHAIMDPALRHTVPYVDIDKDGKQISVHSGGGVIFATPGWYNEFFRWIYYDLPDRFFHVAWNWTLLNPPAFQVLPTFKDGVLDELLLWEGQGNGHPSGGHVTLQAGRLRKPRGSNTNVDTGGYWIHQKMSEDGKVWTSTLVLDDGATSEERKRALNFRFDCFTTIRACNDGLRMLNPAPARPSQRD